MRPFRMAGQMGRLNLCHRMGMDLLLDNLPIAMPVYLEETGSSAGCYVR